MKPAVIVILTTFLSVLLLSASFAAAQQEDRSENTCWWSAWRTCLVTPPATAKAEVEPAKAQVAADKTETIGPATIDEAKQTGNEAKAIQTEAREEIEEEEAADKANADSASVEIEITIRIGSTERTVKLEMPMGEFQVPVLKAKATRKAKSEEDQTTAAVHVPATPIFAENAIKEEVKALEPKTVAVEGPAKVIIPELPARQEIKAADEQKSINDSQEIEEGDPLLKEVAVMVRQGVTTDIASAKIDPAFWEKLEIPALPAAPIQWRTTFADAFGVMPEMLSSMWQQTARFVAAMSRLSAEADAQASRLPE